MDESLSDVQTYCIEQFSQRDFVLEPEVISTLLAFFQAGGQPETVIDLLTTNYYGYGQLANLIGCWLADAESTQTSWDSSLVDFESPKEDDLSSFLANAKTKIEGCSPVLECFEATMSAIISKCFRPESADKIFEMHGNEGIDWLPELISYRPWRQLIYELAEHYPNCLMLNFAVKLISDAGFQHEISNVNTAAQQLDIFSRVLLSSIDALLMEYAKEGENSESFQKNFAELMRIAAHSEQTFLITQALLHVLSLKETGKMSAVCAHISQLLHLEFKQTESRNICPLFVGIVIQSRESRIEDPVNSDIVQAMLTMITKQALNPADIQTVYQAYFEPCPPPVDLICDAYFMNLLIDEIFNVSNKNLNLDYRPKYVYLLAYAACVSETVRNGIRVQSKLELDSIRSQMNELLKILHGESGSDLISSLDSLLRLIKVPILAAGLLHYLKTLILRKLILAEPLPVHYALIDQIVCEHVNLHTRIFKILCELYDHQSARNEAAETIMERQRNIIDRFMHLFIQSNSLAVVEKIQRMFKDGIMDVSLVRYFVVGIMEQIEGPYSQEFTTAFLPLVANSEIFDNSKLEKNLAVKKFVQEQNLKL